MADFTLPKLYGIIGSPLGHSLSPILHTTAFQALGIPGLLLPWPMPADQLPVFIKAMRLLDIQGACVTIPHKQAIMPLLDGISDTAKKVGAVNLVHRDGDRLLGDNTDILGFTLPLADPPLPTDTPVLLLGAGGATRGVIAGLHMLGMTNIHISNRTAATAADMAAEFGLKAIDWSRRGKVMAGLVVNTTPLGMKGKFEEETPYPGEWLAGRAGIAYDIVYTPVKTRFIREAEAAGWRTLTGLDMFMGQADQQFLTWTGRHLPDVARQVVVDALMKDTSK